MQLLKCSIVVTSLLAAAIAVSPALSLAGPILNMTDSVSLSASGVQFTASAKDYLTISRDTAFHAVQGVKTRKVEIIFPPENEHTWMMVEDILETFGLPKDVLVVEAHMNNAIALILRNVRVIAYDPSLIYSAGPELGGLGYRFVLAHELGHHVCGHTISKFRDDPWKFELEADRMAGYIVTHLDEYIKTENHNRILSAVKTMLPKEGSETHPPLAERLSAIQEGMKGSRCAISNSR